MRLDLTDLGLFVHVCAAGSITGGAARACMTLASASERIRGMEARLGTPLLLRQPRGVATTEAGAVLLQHARQVLDQVQSLHLALRPFGRGQAPIRVHANTSALSDLLPRRLPAFLRAHPGVRVDTEEHGSPQILEAVRRGTCELGIASDAAAPDGLHSIALRPDPLALVVPAGHALAGRAPLALRSVMEQPFVGLMEDAALQVLIARHLAADATPVSWRLRVRALEDICRMVGEGVGLGVVPAAVVQRVGRRHGVRAVALTDAWAQRSLQLCMRDPAALSPPARALVEHLRPKRRGRG